MLTKLNRGLGVVLGMEQQGGKAGVLFQIAGGKGVVAGRETNQALLPRGGLVAVDVGFPGGGVDVHALNFTWVRGWAEGKRHVFAVGQFHGDGLPGAKLQLQKGVLAVVEMTGGKVRVANVFLSDDFHKMVGRAGRVRRPKCRRRSQ